MKTTNIFFLLTFFLFTISCKKEKETDNPNINHRTVNLEMKVSSYNADAEMSVDVNDDGMQGLGDGLHRPHIPSRLIEERRSEIAIAVRLLPNGQRRHDAMLRVGPVAECRKGVHHRRVIRQL